MARQVSKFTVDEKEKLLDFDELHHGKPGPQEWKELAQNMDRDLKSLQACLMRLKKKRNCAQLILRVARYSLVEDQQILQFIKANLHHIDLTNPVHLKSLRSHDFAPLADSLQRSGEGIYEHFHGFLLPTILPTLPNSMLNVGQWEKAMINYVIDHLIDWPSVLTVVGRGLTKAQISLFISNARIGCNEECPGMLYKEIAAHRNKIPLSISVSLPKWIQARKAKVIDIYESVKTSQ